MSKTITITVSAECDNKLSFKIMPIINRVADKVIVILKQRKRILWVTEEKTF